MGFLDNETDLAAFLMLPPPPLVFFGVGGTFEDHGRRPGFECGEWEQPQQMGHPCPAGVDKIRHL